MDHENLQARIDWRVAEIKRLAELFPWDERKCYAAYMRQVYEFSQYSPTLLALAGVHTTGDLQWRFFKHVSEEERHEVYAKRDVENLGYNFDDLAALSTTKAFVKSQFWYIQHGNPIAFYGYVMLLETLAIDAGPVAYKIASQAFGKKCTKFLGLHILEDDGHVKSGWEQIRQMDPTDIKAIAENFDTSADLFCQILEGCIDPYIDNQPGAVVESEMLA